MNDVSDIQKHDAGQNHLSLDIYQDDIDRQIFLDTLTDVCPSFFSFPLNPSSDPSPSDCIPSLRRCQFYCHNNDLKIGMSFIQEQNPDPRETFPSR